MEERYCRCGRLLHDEQEVCLDCNIEKEVKEREMQTEM